MTVAEIFAAYADELAQTPWLAEFVEDGDVSLDEAAERWRDTVNAAKAELRAKGIELHRRMTTRHGLQTTAWAMTTEES